MIFRFLIRLLPRSFLLRWWRASWWDSRQEHIDRRLLFDFEGPRRPEKIKQTPWIYLDCWCPCDCPNAFNHRTEANVQWPTRCLTCRLIDRRLGLLTPFPDDLGGVGTDSRPQDHPHLVERGGANG